MNILKSQTKIYRYKRDFLWDRDTYLIELCAGKKVLHIGATDWPNTKEKLKDSSLLHTKIMSVAEEVVGIDISEEGITILNNAGITNILNVDINSLDTIDFEPDIILFGETIEHIMNMRIIFDGFRKVMKKDTKLVISTPNSNYSIISVLGFFGFEFVHYDHNVIFSTGTLTQLLEKNGLKVDNYFYTFISRKSNSFVFKSLHFLSKIIGYILPWKGETLLFITSLQHGGK